MKLKKAKICGDCRVYSPTSQNCTIGYNTDTKKGAFDVRIGYPLEPCPKPLTVSDSIEAIRNFKKN